MKKVLILGLIAVVGFGLMAFALWPSGESKQVATAPAVGAPVAAAPRELGPDDICGRDGGIFGDDLDGAGFIDNDGNWLEQIDSILYDRLCSGQMVNVRVKLSNDRPLETCDECRRIVNVYREGDHPSLLQ